MRDRYPRHQPWLCALLLAVGLSGPAHAAPWFIECSVDAIGPAFGLYDTSAPQPLTTAGSVTVRCWDTSFLSLVTAYVPYSVTLSAGTSGNQLTRTMRSGASSLHYNLYTDAQHSRIWGNGLGGTQKVFGSFTFLPLLHQIHERTHSVHAKLPAGQDVPPGEYVDTIVVTVEF